MNKKSLLSAVLTLALCSFSLSGLAQNTKTPSTKNREQKEQQSWYPSWPFAAAFGLLSFVGYKFVLGANRAVEAKGPQEKYSDKNFNDDGLAKLDCCQFDSIRTLNPETLTLKKLKKESQASEQSSNAVVLVSRRNTKFQVSSGEIQQLSEMSPVIGSMIALGTSEQIVLDVNDQVLLLLLQLARNVDIRSILDSMSHAQIMQLYREANLLKAAPLLQLLTEPHNDGSVHSYLTPLLARITYEQLLQQFTIIEFINDGQEAKVYKIRKKLTNELYALRVNLNRKRTLLNARENFFRKMMKIQAANPHMIKIYGVFWLENKNCHLLCNENKKPQVHDDENDGYHEVMIMELGHDELTVNTLEIEIQRTFSCYFLERAGIFQADDYLRNHVWKKVSNEKYNGQPMSRFKYWHYQFGEFHLYLPAPQKIVKRVDYGSWNAFDTEDLDSDVENLLKELATRFGLSLDALVERYKMPDLPSDEILHIYFR